MLKKSCRVESCINNILSYHYHIISYYTKDFDANEEEDGNELFDETPEENNLSDEAYNEDTPATSHQQGLLRVLFSQKFFRKLSSVTPKIAGLTILMLICNLVCLSLLLQDLVGVGPFCLSDLEISIACSHRLYQLALYTSRV